MADEKQSWRDMIDELLIEGETIMFCTRPLDEMSEPFDAEVGNPGGKPFLVWSELHVFFPASCNGAQVVGKVPRSPRLEDYYFLHAPPENLG